MNKKTIVADSGPLIAFARIKKISLLSTILGEIIVPEAVAKECINEIQGPGAVEIQKAINKKNIQVFPENKIKKKIRIV